MSRLNNSPKLFQATVYLSDAQIKTLPTVPVTIIAAPGQGLVAVPISGFVQTKFITGYTTTNLASWGLLWIPSNTSASSLLRIFPLLSVGNPQLGIIRIGCPYFETGKVNFDVTTTTGGNYNYGNNEAVAIADYYGGVANYTGGGPANSARVSLIYYILDLNSGLHLSE